MSRTPLYKAAETEMIARITRGDWEIGRRLPNEFQLAEEFGVSQGTMRRALISLEGMGFLNRKPGRGTLVAANAPDAEAAGGAALEPVVLATNGAPLTLGPFRGRTEGRSSTPDEADLLGTDRVISMERTLKSGADRAAIEATVLPAAILDACDEDAPALLGALLDHHGIAYARIEAAAAAEMTDMGQSVALSVDRHTSLLVVTSVAYDASDRAIACQTLRIATPGASLAHRPITVRT